MKRVAVIMSVYKSDCLKDFQLAVDSILSQTIKCNLVIFKDGPLSQEINEYISKINLMENVVVLSSDTNLGLANALNEMISYCLEGKYDYIARMDSDDISYTNRIEEQVNFLESNSAVDVVGSFCREFGSSFALEEKKLPTSHENLLNFSITRCPFIHPSVMFRSSVFLNGSRYPTNTKHTEDMALWFDLLDQGKVFANMPQVLLDYRMTENTPERRRGFLKAVSEIKLRTKYMFKLNRFNFINSAMIFSRIVFHLLPTHFIKKMYLYLR